MARITEIREASEPARRGIRAGEVLDHVRDDLEPVGGGLGSRRNHRGSNSSHSHFMCAA